MIGWKAQTLRLRIFTKMRLGIRILNQSGRKKMVEKLKRVIVARKVLRPLYPKSAGPTSSPWIGEVTNQTKKC